MGSTIREGGTQHWAGKALSLSNERWLKRARGAALKRYRSKQYFGTMKRLFGLHRARYLGVAKTHAQMVMVAISQKLLKGANKITLNKPQQSHNVNQQRQSAP